MFYYLKSGADTTSACFVAPTRSADDSVITRRTAITVLDTCDCDFQDNVGSGPCGELVSGDEIALHSMAPNFILHAVRLDVISGVAGGIVTVNLYKRVDCEDEAAGVELVMPLISAHPLDPFPVTSAEPDACTGKIDFSAICGNKCAPGGSAYFPLDPVMFLGDMAENPDQNDYFISVVFDALPEDWDCSKCCIKLRLSVDQDAGSDKIT